MAIVQEIQVCGGRCWTNLADACWDYLACIEVGTDREKIHFSILMDDGSTRSITFRQDGDEVIVYGNFEGLLNALELASKLLLALHKEKVVNIKEEENDR